MIFETHAHYDDEQFTQDQAAVLASLSEYGIRRVVNVGASLASTKASVELTKHYEFLYAAVGVHPSEIGELTEESFAWLRTLTGLEKVAAVGEIGLDYYWEKEEAVQKQQRYWFKRQLDLAEEAGLPVIIHSRDAAEDTLRIMKEAHVRQIPGVIHCYSYSPELAKEFVKMGYYIGVGGVVTFKNAKKLRETVIQLPLEHLLLETDCPYLAPEPNRGKRNDSRNLPYIVSKIAELKGCSTEEVEHITWENAKKLYQRITEAG